jgi:hypothetical protein
MKKNISFKKHKYDFRGSIKNDVSSRIMTLKGKLDLFDFNYEDRYKQFLCQIFHINKELSNPIIGAILCFGSDNIRKMAYSVRIILDELKRKYIFIEFDGKTFIQSVSYHTGKKCVTNYESICALREILLNTDSVVVLIEFSKCKIKGDKSSLLRSIIKIKDDENISASDLIFIDYAKYFRKMKGILSPYLSCII